MAKDEFWNADPVESKDTASDGGAFWLSDPDAARQELPPGVEPSKAGGGRSTLGLADYQRPAPEPKPRARWEDNADQLMADTAAQPAKSLSVLQSQPWAAPAPERRLSMGAGPISQQTAAAAESLVDGRATTEQAASPVVRRAAVGLKKQVDAGQRDTFGGLVDRSQQPATKELATKRQADEWRSVGEVANDTAAALLSGGVSLVQLPVNIIAPGSALNDSLKKSQQNLQDFESEPMKARRQQLADRVNNEEGFIDQYAATVSELVSNPSVAIHETMRQAAMFAGVLAAARGGSAVAQGGVSMAGRASPTLALGEAISGGAIASRAAGLGATAGGVGAASTMAAGDAAGNAYDKLMNSPQSMWDQSEDYRALIAKGMSPQEAKQEIATAKARTAAMIAAPLGLLGFMGAEASFVARGAGRAASGRPLRTVATELVTEPTEEALTQVAGNYAAQTVNPEQSLGEGAGEAAGMATVTSGPFAGAAAINEMRRPVDRTEQIKALRASGDTTAADMLKRRFDREMAVFNAGSESQRLAQFGSAAQETYRQIRMTGAQPGDAVIRTAIRTGYEQASQMAGLSPKAKAALEATLQKTPPEKAPAVVQKYITALAQSGAAQPFEGLDTLADSIEAQMDGMLDAVIAGDIRPTMNAIQELENQSEATQAAATDEQAAAAIVDAVPAEAIPDGEGAVSGVDQQELEAALTDTNDVLVTPEMDAVHSAATSPLNDLPEPTQAQKDVGNYKVGRVRISGMDISVENPQGSVRRGTDQDGNQWQTPLRDHYGYFRGTTAADGDKLDVFIKPGTPEDYAGKVFVVDQIDPKTGKFDEAKVIFGAADQQEAEAIYRRNYSADWQGFGAITELPMPAFKAWAKSNATRKPLGVLPSRDVQDATQGTAGEAQAPADQAPEAARGDDAAAAGVPAEAGAGAAQADGVSSILGRDSVPISEGGKPFKTKAEADKAEKLDDRAQIKRESEAGADTFMLSQEDGRQDTTGNLFSIRTDSGNQLPEAIIGSDLGAATKHPDYYAAKAGDTDAAIKVAVDLVTPELVNKVRSVIGSSKPMVVPVVSVEASGRNKIPLASAEVLAKRLGLKTEIRIVQSNSPKRTAMDGLDRIFAAPEFDGPVVSGRDYLILDDTLTQGATFAALASHIQRGGGRVVGSVALTGKQYSAKLKPSAETLKALREKHGDLESDFKAATGYGFDALTESEARYLANFKPTQSVRDRILEAGRRAGKRKDQGASRLSAGDGGVTDTADYGPATQAHRDAAARLAESFADRIEGGGSHTDLLDAVAPGDGKRGQAAAAVANIARRLFRRQVVFVKFKGTPLFNGVVSKSVPGVIFLNIDSQKPLMAVLGHELLHEMAKSQPTMYANLSRRLDDLIKNETEYAVRTYNAYKKAGISTKGLDTREELEADIVGDNFMDAGFWQAMGENQPGLFRRIVNFVMAWLDNLSQKITDYRPFGTDEFLTDIAAARAAVADAMRQFSGAEVGSVTDGTDADAQLSIAAKAPAQSPATAPVTPQESLPDAQQPPTKKQPDLFTPSFWDVPQDTRTDKFIYEAQDGRIDVKRVQQAIAKVGGEIREQFDARLAETLYPGRVARRAEQFLEDEAKPLLEVMARNNVSIAELSDYLHARGAEERNAQIAKVNPDLPDGGAGRNSNGVLMTNAAAREYLASVRPARKMVLDALAKRVDSITAGTRKLLVDEGLEKPETIAAWEAAYKNYVPMFRDEAEQGRPHPTGSGMSVRGSASKRATGSTKEVTNILAHVLMQREAAITRAEKNRVAVALYGLALTNPNPDFWTTIRPGMDPEAIGRELQRMGIDPTVAEAGMRGVPTIRTVDPVLGRVVDRPNPIYKNMSGAIVLKVNGEDRVLMLNENDPRGLRMAENLKNLDGLTRLDLASSVVGKATRWLASVNTQYNPAFGLVNLTRDTLGGAINLSSTPLRGKATKVLAMTPAALAGIGRELSGAKSGEWGKLWRQYQADGGQTGYREMFKDANDRTKRLQAELRSLEKAGKLTSDKVAGKVLGALDIFNTTLENAVRLAAYKEALSIGMSRAEAARLGRELTVDFNRKGRTVRELSPLYAFLNASVQGQARNLVALASPAGKKIIAGGLTLGVLQALMLLFAGYEEDEVPEFVKTRALIVPLGTDEEGKKQFFTIPYPLGFHVIPNTGRVLAELTLSGGEDAPKRLFDAVGEIAAAFNPLGGGNIFTPDGALRTIAPSIVDPIIEIGANKNFAGAPIERESQGENDPRPGHQRVREGTLRTATGQAYTDISRIINTMTGGDDYEKGLASPTPEMIRYLAQVVGGGLLREIEKSVNTSVDLVKDNPVKSSGIPIVGRFYGEVDDANVQRSRYFDNLREIETLERKIRAAENAGDLNAADRIEAKGIAVEASSDARRAKRDIRELNTEAMETIGDRTKLRQIDEERTEVMRELNEVVDDIKRKARGPTPGERLRSAVIGNE